MGIVFVFTRCLIKKIPDVFPCNSNICRWILIFIGWIVSQKLNRMDGVIILSITSTFRRCDGGLYHLFNVFFAVFDPLPLTRWINCSF